MVKKIGIFIITLLCFFIASVSVSAKIFYKVYITTEINNYNEQFFVGTLYKTDEVFSTNLGIYENVKTINVDGYKWSGEYEITTNNTKVTLDYNKQPFKIVIIKSDNTVYVSKTIDVETRIPTFTININNNEQIIQNNYRLLTIKNEFNFTKSIVFTIIRIILFATINFGVLLIFKINKNKWFWVLFSITTLISIYTQIRLAMNVYQMGYFTALIEVIATIIYIVGIQIIILPFIFIKLKYYKVLLAVILFNLIQFGITLFVFMSNQILI